MKISKKIYILWIIMMKFGIQLTFMVAVTSRGMQIKRCLIFLTYFYLKKKRLITSSEFDFFEYEIRRILMNNQVVKYLYDLYHFSSKHKMHFTFYYLFLCGKRKTYSVSLYEKRIKFFNEEFFNPQSPNYLHYLNF